MSIYDRFSEQELAVLQARAERVASAGRGVVVDNVLSTLVVKIRDETYALPLKTINYILDGNTRVIPVPCVPPFVAGIANVRGHIVPVLDLATLLGVPGEAQSGDGALVVAANDEMTVAFRVEAIGDVLYLLTDKLTPLPPTLDIEKTAYLQGTLPDGTGLLDVDAILDDPGLVVAEASA
jgi:purine-binding chemotaxis protein CheW